MAEIVFFRRGEEVLRFALGDDRVTIGRGDKCDVVVPDPEVSRMQLALHIEGDKCVVQDLSTKGSVVSGKRVKEGQFPDGTDFSLGQWRAVFRLRGSVGEEGVTEVGKSTALYASNDPVDSPRIPAQLKVRQGGNEMTVRLKGEALTIGKDSSNDVPLDSRFVSGKHARISRNHNRFVLSDHHSTNGTFIGNNRIFEAEISFFSTFRIGDIELFIEPQTANRGATHNYFGIIGNDSSIKQLGELIDRVAPSSAAVAIFGESGTGKELAARAVHQRSLRADQPFIPVNCAAISKDLIESELFGHEKGAFTGAQATRLGAFEEADKGTLFLDEIGELPLELQAKLLRALESGEVKRVGAARPIHVDVRLVTATNRDLMAAARDGKFREDLYYRLCVIPVHLSPLRSRSADVPAIVEHFLKSFSPKGQVVSISKEAHEILTNHSWPGNVRELRNVVHRALLLRKGPVIEASDIAFDQRSNSDVKGLGELPTGLTLDELLLRAERQIVEACLKRHQMNRDKCAKELGMSRSTLFKRLKEWNMM
jgi:two-component system, NtrC family, response regulator HydG